MMKKEIENFLNLLESGELRAAYKKGEIWITNTEVKKGILEVFKNGKNILERGFIDKDNIFPREFSLSDNIRLVPGGSSVRRGAHLAKNVVIMPPSYVNIGAYVGEDSMIDSNVLVGSCAQIGKNVHISAGVQIGGVLEPISESPVIIEDDAFIGAGAIIVEGVRISKNAIITPGVVLSKSVPIYDIVNSRMLDIGEAIPENAIVVQGVRSLKEETDFSKKHSLKMSAALIVKYRDLKSSDALKLESILR